MLVFTRKVGQSLVIGNDIEVEVLSTNGDHVRIGIRAPREIPVHREEVHQAIAHQNRLASRSLTPSKELLLHLNR